MTDETQREEKEATVPVEESAAADSDAGQGTGPDGPERTSEEALAEKDALVEDLQKQVLYLHAELENFKKRTEKRYREALEFASEPLLRDLLPVLDNLERAVEHGRDSEPEGGESLIQGLEHVVDQFREALTRHHVEPLEAAGEKFDPSVHEALFQVPGEQDGRVATVYEKGYRLKGRLLRPAKVAVTKVASAEGDG